MVSNIDLVKADASPEPPDGGGSGPSGAALLLIFNGVVGTIASTFVTTKSVPVTVLAGVIALAVTAVFALKKK